MKKLFLLGALVCASQMYGMEPLYPKKHDILAGTWENLPTEIKLRIIIAIDQSGNNLGQAIKNIVTFSQVNKELNKMINLNDLQGFTKIVHMLVDTFREKLNQNFTIDTVAGKFETPVSKTYLNLASELGSAIYNDNINEVTQLIEKGADVNYSFCYIYDNGASLLTQALAKGNIKIIKLLLDSGANPNFKNVFGETAFEWAKKFITDEKIKQLLESYKK